MRQVDNYQEASALKHLAADHTHLLAILIRPGRPLQRGRGAEPIPQTDARAGINATGDGHWSERRRQLADLNNVPGRRQPSRRRENINKSENALSDRQTQHFLDAFSRAAGVGRK